MEESKRRIVLALILVATITISVLGTYAYFLTQGNDNNVEQKLTIKTGTLALTFEDNDAGINQSITLGESVTKEFIIRNTGAEAVTTNMLWKNLVNTYIQESLSYKLEYKTSEDGTWEDVETVSSNIPRSVRIQNRALAKNLTIPANEVYYYRLTIKFENLPDINQEQDKTASLSTTFALGNVPSSIEETLAQLNITPNAGNPTFASAATNDEGVYSMPDDYGTSYYYRGAVTNNYVKFGGFYWRIIRINGDGSVRMQYDGTQAYDNANGGTGSGGADRFTHTGKAWNANSNDNKYVGWMFGGADGEASK